LKKYKVLDLFSGIGGFSLGLERAGMETVAFCEIEPFPQRVLKKHWPDVPIYSDVMELTNDRLKADGIKGIDIITGGFPCQDLSTAGQRAGITGERSGLWGECKRLLSEIRPRYAIFENVANLLTGENGAWFSRVLTDLASIGYNVEWHNIPASAVGLPHLRERVWIIAYTSKERRDSSIFKGRFESIRDMAEQQRANSSRKSIISWIEGQGGEQGHLRGKPCISRNDDGFSEWMDRVAALGNAVVPQIPEIIGRAIIEVENETIRQQ